MDGTPTIDPPATPESPLLALSPDLLGTVGPAGLLTYVNPAWAATLGWPDEHLLATPLPDLAVEDDRDQAEAILAGADGDCRMTCADGGERHVRWTARVQHDGTVQLAGRDVTELERMADELQDFAYVASHDLAEPVRMVTAYLELLQRRYAGQLDETADEFIGYAVDGAVRMQAMIDALLAFSRVGTHVMERAEFTLGEVLGPELPAGVTLADPSAVVVGDPTQIAQLLHQLIDNGVKFRTPDRDPRVTVSACGEDEGVRIDVADNGMGIPEAQQDRVFRMFSRLHGRDEFPGTGVGLALCRRIAQRHGGTVRLTSTPDTGTVVSVWLPR